MPIGPIGSQGGMSAAYLQFYRNANLSAARSRAANPSQPEQPVAPVPPVRSVKPDAAVRLPVPVEEPSLPTEQALNNAADNLARMRIRQAEESAPSDMQTKAQAAVQSEAETLS